MIQYRDRLTGKKETEKVYGEGGIRFLYGNPFGIPLMHLISRLPLVSKLVGWWQRQPFTRKKIAPFIQEYNIDAGEFEKKVEEFDSFNDFFVRKLKPEARPICAGEDIAVIPADGRFLFYPDIEKADGFVVKGKKFSLESLLQDSELATAYAKGAMVIGRLCPSDYHRFHFPCSGLAGMSHPINGSLYSVNPLALQHNLNIMVENKRTLCHIQTERFGKLLYLEIGATNVGSITQSYTPETRVQKGDEKGFFSFGGSTVILLFEPNTIQFDNDLLNKDHQEIRCLLGQSMGKAVQQLS